MVLYNIITLMASKLRRFFHLDSGSKDNVTSEWAICSGEENSSSASLVVTSMPVSSSLRRGAVPGRGANLGSKSFSNARSET